VQVSHLASTGAASLWNYECFVSRHTSRYRRPSLLPVPYAVEDREQRTGSRHEQRTGSRHELVGPAASTKRVGVRLGGRLTVPPARGSCTRWRARSRTVRPALRSCVRRAWTEHRLRSSSICWVEGGTLQAAAARLVRPGVVDHRLAESAL